MGQIPLTVRHWRRVEYERLVNLGAFDGDPVELIDGHLIVAEPQDSPHATAVGAADDALRAGLPTGFLVRAQMPLALDDDSSPEPDLAVVRGRRADYRRAHPAHAALVIEVADSSLEFDRQVKGSLYARARIEEYWIVNLIDRTVEVYREPGPVAGGPPRWRYRVLTVLAPPAVAEPIALPGAAIRVADLLPTD